MFRGAGSRAPQLNLADGCAGPSAEPGVSPWLVFLAVTTLGFSSVITQLALMRELLGSFSGNEMVLGLVLGLWLLLMGVGACLGRRSERLANPSVWLGPVLILTAIIPLAQVLLCRGLRNVIFVRGADVGMTETLGFCFVLLLPYCLIAGAGLTLACFVMGRASGPAGVGKGYVGDSIGSIVGGALFSFVLVGAWDHFAILVFPALLSLCVAIALGLCCRRIRIAVLAFVLALGVMGAGLFADLDRRSTGWQYAGQEILDSVNSPYGKLVVAESGGQLDFTENGLPLVSSRDDARVEETVHFALAQRPRATRVLLVSGGFSGTATEILKHHVERVDYLELDPLLLDLARKHLPQNLSDPRIRTINSDTRLYLRQTKEKYDCVILDLPAPSTAQLNRFYTTEALLEMKHVLVPGGVVCFALGHYENYVSPELARLLSSTRRSLYQCFQNTLVLPAGRVFFLGSDGPLYSDIAARLERAGISTKLLNRHYLEAMLTPDRLADMARATAQPAAINTDFNPVLYFYHLRHWIAQFSFRFGRLEILIGFGLAIYFASVGGNPLRGGAVVLFAGGFTGAGLELVLLLGFQVLCGSVYRQMGIIVAAFMAGLALGAWVTTRTCANFAHRRWLAASAILLAGFSILVPAFLSFLARYEGMNFTLVPIQTSIGLATLLLGALVGIQFPLANRLDFTGSASIISRLYLADFVGASLGALVCSSILLPLIGFRGVCLLTALLNIGAAGLVLLSGFPRRTPGAGGLAHSG